MDHDALFRTMYAAFNARNADAVLVTMTDDVDWPKAFEGGRVVGRDAVKEYWLRQWKEIDPTVTPTKVELRGEDQYVVHVDQRVKDMEGKELDHRQVKHVYTVRDGLIAKMDLGE